MIPDPPQFLGAFGIAAWRAGYVAIAARGMWEPIFRFGLGLLAGTAEAYCEAVIEARARRRPLAPEEATEIEAKRGLVREMMADWLLLPAKRVRLAVIRPDRLDADIAALCGIAGAPCGDDRL